MRSAVIANAPSPRQWGGVGPPRHRSPSPRPGHRGHIRQPDRQECDVLRRVTSRANWRLLAGRFGAVSPPPGRAGSARSGPGGWSRRGPSWRADSGAPPPDCCGPTDPTFSELVHSIGTATGSCPRTRARSRGLVRVPRPPCFPRRRRPQRRLERFSPHRRGESGHVHQPGRQGRTGDRAHLAAGLGSRRTARVWDCTAPTSLTATSARCLTIGPPAQGCDAAPTASTIRRRTSSCRAAVSPLT